MVGFGIEIDYKEMVMELAERVRFGKASGAMLELRLSLFVAACGSRNSDQTLYPFPPCFFDGKTQSKDFDGLKEHLKMIPPLDKLDQDIELPALTWELAYWVFTNPLTISPLFDLNYDHPKMLDSTIADETKLKVPGSGSVSLSSSGSGFLVFGVVNPTPKPEFVEGKERYGSYFAFHGSPLCNFHSIIHRGFLKSLNKRSAYGVGTYFSSEFKTSSGYATIGTGSFHSAFGSALQCVAICEIVDAPTGLTKHKHGTREVIPAGSGVSNNENLVTVVADDNLIQLTYLLLSAPGLQKPYVLKD